jgi:hypothetical protein
MIVAVGGCAVEGPGEPLPRNRKEAKQVLRAVAKACGVKRVSFVKHKKPRYGGTYQYNAKRIIVVEKEGSRVVPIYVLAYRLLHELTHHLQHEGGIFLAFYCSEYKDEKGKLHKVTNDERRRVALRAERHADKKAVELCEELFELKLKPMAPYSKSFLKKMRKELFE